MRLQTALDRQGYPSVKEGRNTLFAEEFGLGSTSAQKILTQNHVPSKGKMLETISRKANISPAYWRYGLDSYIEERVASLRDKAWEAILAELKSEGRSLNDLPTALLANFADVVYRHALDNDDRIDSDHLKKILALAIDLSAN